MRAWLVEELERKTLLATFMVTNTSDSGAGSLRQAILSADSATGPNTIAFSIGSGVQTIQPLSALPAITGPTVIDGTTQPGSSGFPAIILDGTDAGIGVTGLLITAGNSTIRGLVIDNFNGSGLVLQSGGNNLVVGDFIGTDATGVHPAPNGGGSSGLPGMLVSNSAGNTIGGATAGAENVISGNNGDGLDIQGSLATGNLVEGNAIGLDVTGEQPVPNHGNGITISLGAGGNSIGGTTGAAGNVISGNQFDGIEVDAPTSGTPGAGNLFQGNLVGTDLAGTKPLHNNQVGVEIEAPGDTIGGTASGAGNVISGNGNNGLRFAGTVTTGNLVQGNMIGTDATGALDLHNAGGAAILFTSTGDVNSGAPSNNTIGGTTPGAGNTIVRNNGDGVNVQAGQGIAVLGNAFSKNSGMGINLNQPGNANTSGAMSPGQPNQGMNLPTITSASCDGTSLAVAGYVGMPNDAIFAGDRIEVYEAAAMPGPNHAQGQVLLGVLTADANGNFQGTFTVGGVAPSNQVTCTATDAAGNTSEFASTVPVQASTTTTLASSTSTSVYGQNVTFTATVNSAFPSPGPAGPVTFLDNGQIVGSAPLNDSGVATFNVANLPAGTQSISAQYNGNPTYQASTSGSITQTVTPASLTVSANNDNDVYGHPLPPLHATYAGLAGGDTPASIGPLTLSCPATSSSGVGSYLITPSGLNDPNYTITYQTGTLTITPAPLTVKANDANKVYGQPNPTFSATYTGLVNGDTLTTLGALSYSTPATQSSAAGAYPIAPSGLNDPNYTITYQTGTLHVTPAPLTVTTNSASKVYGQPNPAFTATFSGLVNGDTPTTVGTPGFGTPATSSSAVGTYPVTPGGLNDPNYAIRYQAGTLSITPATLTVAANSASKAYGAPNPVFTATYTGLINGDTPNSVGPLTFNTPANSSTGIGNYPLTPAGLNDPNYTVTYQGATLTITPAPLTVTANAATAVYGAALPAFSATFRGLVNGDTPAALGGLSYTTPATIGSPAGNYSIAPSGLSDPNYTITYQAGTLTISPAPLTVSVDRTSKEYGQPNPNFNATVTGLVNGDDASMLGTPAYSTQATATSGAGSYPVTVSGLSDPNYAITYQAGTLTVTPASLTVTANNANQVYGQSPPAFTAAFNGLTAGDTPATVGTVTFSTTATASSGVGIYPITPSGLSDPNYTITYQPGTLGIAPASLTVAANSASKVYGAPNPTFTATYSGLTNGDTPNSIGPLTFRTPASSSSGVGDYSITPSGLNDPNYTVTYQGATLAITPTPLTVTANSPTAVYGAALPAFSATFDGLVTGDTSSALGALSYTTPAAIGSPVGSYPIIPSGLSDANYTITYQAGTLTITPAPLTVTADDSGKVYGQPNPTFTATFTGLVNGDTAATVGTPLLTTPANASSGVGNYPITPSGLNDPNYAITYQSGTLAITPAALTVAANDASQAFGQPNPAFTASYTGLTAGDTPGSVGPLTFRTPATNSSGVGNYPITPAGLTDPNYMVTYQSGTLRIEPTPLTVTANDVGKVYGQPNPAFSATFSGLAGGDTPGSVGALTFRTPATDASGVGTYPIIPSGLSDPNYTITYQSGTLAVTPALLTVAADGASKVYGQPNPTFTAAYTGLVNGDTAADVGPISLDTSATSSSPVGSYPITPSGLTDANYAIVYESATLAVTPAALTITTNGTSKVYGQPNPTFTATYHGLTAGDTPSSVGTLTFRTPANSSSSVGNYAVTPSGLTDPNYTITYQSGTLGITTAPLTVTGSDATRVYGEPNPAFTAMFSGLVNGDVPSDLGTLSFATTADASGPVGQYPLTPGGLTASNYRVTYAPATLTITAAPLIVTADDASKVAGQPNPVFSASFTGLVNGDSAADLGTLSFSTAATASSPAGDYAVTPFGLVAANYTVTYAPGILVVTIKPETTLFLSPSSAVYGQMVTLQAVVSTPSGAPTGTVEFLQGGQALGTAPIINGAATLAVTDLAAGADIITAHYNGDPADPPMDSDPLTETVARAPVTVRVDDSAMVYGGPLPTFSAAFTGLADGDTPADLGTLAFATTASPSSATGSYPIAAHGLSDPNYTITYQPGTLTVAPAPLTVRVNEATRLYGQTNPAFTASFTGLVNGDTPASIGALAFSTTANNSSRVGSYTITPSGLSDPNYAITYQDGALTVTPAPLTVTANDPARLYGQPNPAFTSSITGLVNGDTPADLGALSLTTSATISSRVGSYTITPPGLSDPNYAITYRDGTLAITPAPLTVAADNATRLYGRPNPVFSASYVGLVNGDTPADLGMLTLTSPAGPASAVDQYPIIASGLSDPNYTITYQNGTLAVTPAPLTVTANDATALYGAPLPAFSASFDGLAARDTPGDLGTLDFQTDASADSPPGTYAVTPLGLSDADYAVTYAPGTLTIAPRALEVTPTTVAATESVPCQGVVATFTDDPSAPASAYSATIDWGDGQTSDGSVAYNTQTNTFSITGTNTYAAAGVYAVSVRVGFMQQSVTVRGIAVVAAPPAVAPLDVSALPVAAQAGASFEGVVASFSDPNGQGHASDYSASITWGDGNVSPGRLSDLGTNAWAVLGTNTFETDGVYAVRVAVTALSGATGAAQGAAVVTPTSLALVASPVTAVAGSPFSGVVAQFSLNDPGAVAADFAVSVDWGDGTKAAASVTETAPGKFTVTGTHVFHAPGAHTLSVVVTPTTGDTSAVDVPAAVSPASAGPVVSPPTRSDVPIAPVVSSLGPLGPPALLPATALSTPTAPPVVTSIVVGDSPLSPGSATPAGGLGATHSTSSGTSPGGSSAHATPARGDAASSANNGAVAAASAVEAVSQQHAATVPGVLAGAGGSIDVRTALPAAEPTKFETLAPLPNTLWHTLDKLEQQVAAGQPVEALDDIVGVGVVAYVGYVLLNTRAAAIVLSVIASRPLWREFDPLTVLAAWEEEKRRSPRTGAGDDEDESLQSLVDQGNAPTDAGANDDTQSPETYQPHYHSTTRPHRRSASRPS